MTPSLLQRAVDQGCFTSDSDLLPPECLRFAKLAARNDYPVLIGGETGSGKTHLARQIHQRSSRNRRAFVSVNCASIPEGLFEAEMFGCVRGAFTDAREARPGMFEAAHGGTLFLDELGDLPLRVQPKILTALEEGTVRRVGATRSTSVDVRVIAASNRDLGRMVQEKSFREDLFYRCAVLEYRVPSLREHSQRLPALILRVLERIARGTACTGMNDDAMSLLCAYSWPGNFRELENTLRQAHAEAEDGPIEAWHLCQRVRGGAGSRQAPRGDRARTRYNAPVDAGQERLAILDALCRENGSRSRAAKRLGMSRAALWNKMIRFQIGDGEVCGSGRPASSVAPGDPSLMVLQGV